MSDDRDPHERESGSNDGPADSRSSAPSPRARSRSRVDAKQRRLARHAPVALWAHSEIQQREGELHAPLTAFGGPLDAGEQLERLVEAESHTDAPTER